MKWSVVDAMIVLFLSFANAGLAAPVPAQPVEHNSAIGVGLTLISGVMTRTSDKWTYTLAEDTKVLAAFAWKDEGYREEPQWSVNSAKVANVQLKRIRLADDSLLELVVQAKAWGDCQLTVNVGGHQTSINFQVR